MTVTGMEKLDIKRMYSILADLLSDQLELDKQGQKLEAVLVPNDQTQKGGLLDGRV